MRTRRGDDVKRLLQLSFSLALIFAPLTLVTGPTDAAIIQALGDDFVLKAGGDVITGGHSWRVYDPSVFLSDNISIRIFDITSGVPNISPIYSNDTAAVTRIHTNVKFGSVAIFEYSVDFPQVSLSPETILTFNCPRWYWAGYLVLVYKPRKRRRC